MILLAFWSPLQSQINPFSPKKLKIPVGISCQKLIDITHMGSWHSCLLSSETLAPFLEFPREWPSFSLQRVWVKISQEVDCSDLEKQQVYWEECRVSYKSQMILGCLVPNDSFHQFVYIDVEEWWYHRLLYEQDPAVPPRMSDWNIKMSLKPAFKTLRLL